ncbi:hypothetical protein BOX15_Mlig015408g1, partial [Macrostomum lignano]
WPAVADIAGAPLFTAPSHQGSGMSPHLADESPAAAFRPVWLNYGGLAFCTSLLQNVFLLYHVDAYVNVFQVDKASFWLAELLFLVWNSVNDYVFGWLSDGGTLAGRRAGRIVERRLRLLARFGPLLALSFALMWLRWLPGWPAVQFLVCLCLYDACLTAVEVHFTALQADLTLRQSERHRLSLGASLGSGAASGSVFVSYLVWDRARLLPFRLFTTFLACVALAGYLLFSRGIRRAHAARSAASDEVDPSEAQEMPSKPLCSQLRSFSGQLLAHKNFVYFCCTQLLQVFHCHFNSNFFPLFLLLLSSEQSSTEYSASTVSLIGSAVLAVSFVLPHLNNVAFLRLCDSYGAYAVVRGLLLAKALSGLFVLTALPTGTLPLACLLLSNRVFTEGVCKLLNLVVSDLVDEDYAMHRRSEPISALIFGSTALLSKPGQTLAPLLGTALFSHFVGRDLLGADRPLAAGAAPLDSAARLGCLRVLGWVPLACGCVQLALWTRFSLHGDRQRRVKELCYRLRAGAAALRFV